MVENQRKLSSNGRTLGKIPSKVKSFSLALMNIQEHKLMTPNYNLRKLIQDLIAEGGAGLYTADATDKGRMIEIQSQKLLIMHCLGPPESDWNQRSFQVTTAALFGMLI